MPKLVRAPRRACAVAASGAAVAERGGEPLYRSSGDARAGAAMHHDLDAVATSALVGVADEFDVARRYRIHGLPLPC